MRKRIQESFQEIFSKSANEFLRELRYDKMWLKIIEVDFKSVLFCFELKLTNRFSTLT